VPEVPVLRIILSVRGGKCVQQVSNISIMATEIPPALLEAMTNMFTNAIRASIPSAANIVNPTNTDEAMLHNRSKPPPFSCKEFHLSERTSVDEYFKRFEWALQFSKIPEEQYANYALVYMGTELNDALKFLITPRKPEDLQYGEIRTTLTAHFDSAKNKYAESVKFRLIRQQKGETIASYALRLRQGATHCEYGDFLDRMLIEQLLHGLESREMCDEIIAKKPDTFKAAYEVAHALEATRHTSDAMKTSNQSATLESAHALISPTSLTKSDKRRANRRSFSRGRRQSQTSRSLSHSGPHKTKSHDQKKQRSCNGCGAQHMRSECPHRDTECHKCKKKGHLARVCRSSNTTTNPNPEKTQTPAEQIDTVIHLNKLNNIKAIRNSKKKNTRSANQWPECNDGTRLRSTYRYY